MLPTSSRTLNYPSDGTSERLNPNPLLDDKVLRDTDMDILVIIIVSLVVIVGGGLFIKRWQDDE